MYIFNQGLCVQKFMSFTKALTVISQVSVHLRVSAHPPFIYDPMVHVYVRYMYKWLLHVSTRPHFSAGPH